MRKKFENDNGQVRLITENQSAASRLANTPLNISNNENLDNIIPTSISTSEERVNTVAVPVENNIERASRIGDREKERGRKTTINIALYTASLLLTAGILLLAQAINLSIQLRFGLVWLFIFYFIIFIGQILYARLPILKSARQRLLVRPWLLCQLAAGL